MSEVFTPKILYVDDEKANTLVFRKSFENQYLVKVAHSGQEALTLLEEESFVLMIVDQRMPGMTGIELCEKAQALYPEMIRMMLTAYQEPALLLSAIQKGHVYDYVVKPWTKSDLQRNIERAFSHYKNSHEKLIALKKQLSKVQLEQTYRVAPSQGFEDWIGAEQGLADVRKMIEQAAPTDSTVLILGETGSGKEKVAHLLHQHSARSQGPFVPAHCAGLTKTLLESELFGYEKGAFTGANQTKKGLFEAASGGTVFLDEIGEIDADTQVKLLRVLQEKKIQRVGSTDARAVDIRIVAATHKDLAQQVQDGHFRADLYYRLNVIPIVVPALRHRLADLSALIQYFLAKLNRSLGKKVQLSDAANQHLMQYDWPGNIRELQNILERAVTLAPKEILDPEDLRFTMGPAYQQEVLTMKPASTTENVRDQVADVQKKKLTDAFMQAQGNVSKAARAMGIARSTLYDQLKKYDLV